MLAANVLRYRYPVVPPGGMHIVDVREVADVLAAVMEPGRGPAATVRRPATSCCWSHARWRRP